MVAMEVLSVDSGVKDMIDGFEGEGVRIVRVNIYPSEITLSSCTDAI